MDTTSRILTLASAMRAVIEDPAAPKPFRDKLFLFAAQLRDALPLEKAFAVEAAEAEAIIAAFVPSAQTRFQLPSAEENLLDDCQSTVGELAKLVSTQ